MLIKLMSGKIAHSYEMSDKDILYEINQRDKTDEIKWIVNALAEEAKRRNLDISYLKFQLTGAL